MREGGREELRKGERKGGNDLREGGAMERERQIISEEMGSEKRRK